MDRRSPVRTRTLALLGVAAGLLFAPAADAAPDQPSSDSQAARGEVLTLKFKIVSRNGEAVRVRGFTFSGLRLNCTEGPATFKLTSPLPSMEISERRRFSGKFKVEGLAVRVQGKFKRSFKKAKGTLRASGDVGAFSNCRSGKADWKAN